MLMKKSFSFLLLFVHLCFSHCVTASFYFEDDLWSNVGPLVTKDQRVSLSVTEFGEISAVNISDGIKGPHHLRFITLEPNSLFLPVLLHADMVSYVHSGSGMLSWIDEKENKQKRLKVERGDIYRLNSGSIFYVQSSLESTREKLRIYAIFTNSDYPSKPQELPIGPYSALSDLVLGFDKKVLQSAFMVPQEVIDEITSSTKPPPIVHMPSKNNINYLDWNIGIMKVLMGDSSYELNNEKKVKTFNILKRRPDVKNCNGWCLSLNSKDFHALRGTNIGVFMVNLTQGSMMGPHWNPRASEIAIVTYGQGMVHVVCPSTASLLECKNMRFRVKEGDVFVVPRFHPMAQMSFNNDSFVFIGFSTMAKKNYPQILAGKRSVLKTLDKNILAVSFNVPNATVDKLFSYQEDSIILGCLSCAEEEKKRMEEEEKKRDEEIKRREEEAKKKEEEKKRREEEEAKKREEEEKKRQEEEAAKKKEEEEKKQREEKEKEEEIKKREEEKKRQEEETKKREEEEKKRQEEEAAKKKEEEEKKQREEKEKEEEIKKREEEKKRQEEEAKKREEEEKKQQEEEVAKKKEEEEKKQREEKEKEEETKKGEEEKKKQEEAKRREKEAAQKEMEEAKSREEERQKREKEEEEAGGSKEEGGKEGGGGEGSVASKEIFIF